MISNQVDSSYTYFGINSDGSAWFLICTSLILQQEWPRVQLIRHGARGHEGDLVLHRPATSVKVSTAAPRRIPVSEDTKPGPEVNLHGKRRPCISKRSGKPGRLTAQQQHPAPSVSVTMIVMQSTSTCEGLPGHLRGRFSYKMPRTTTRPCKKSKVGATYRKKHARPGFCSLIRVPHSTIGHASRTIPDWTTTHPGKPAQARASGGNGA